jgi:hypothetical protein
MKNTGLEARIQGTLKGGENQLAVMSFANAVGKNLACGNINNCCQIPNAPSVNKTT